VHDEPSGPPDGSEEPEEEQPQGPPQPASMGPQIMVPPEEFPGRWANAAQLVRSPHELTLDFIRMGPMWQMGQIVARISFSDVLFAELVRVFNEQWDAYTKEAGIPPESGIPPDNEDDDE
jgi:hypothetical protein